MSRLFDLIKRAELTQRISTKEADEMRDAASVAVDEESERRTALLWGRVLRYEAALNAIAARVFYVALLEYTSPETAKGVCVEVERLAHEALDVEDTPAKLREVLDAWEAWLRGA